jgi:hypothetical protein
VLNRSGGGLNNTQLRLELSTVRFLIIIGERGIGRRYRTPTLVHSPSPFSKLVSELTFRRAAAISVRDLKSSREIDKHEMVKLIRY